MSAAFLAPSVCLALFQDCDYSIDLKMGMTQEIKSYRFPELGSPLNSSCRYVVKAPEKYRVQASCYINFGGKEGECKKELFFVGFDGRRDIKYARSFCGTGQNEWTSKYNKMMLGVFFGTFLLKKRLILIKKKYFV